MGYEADKDRVLKQWLCEATGLTVSINQYSDGEPKLQIGPRVFVKRDGTQSQRKAGRLSMEEVLWLYDIIDDVKDEMAGKVTPG